MPVASASIPPADDALLDERFAVVVDQDAEPADNRSMIAKPKERQNPRPRRAVSRAIRRLFAAVPPRWGDAGR